MEKGKRIYLRPQLEVMNIQTEGVIAASGDSGTVDEETFCLSNCFSGNKTCNCIGPEATSTCEGLVVGKVYKTSQKCKFYGDGHYDQLGGGGAYPVHFKLLPGGEPGKGIIEYWPCDGRN